VGLWSSPNQKQVAGGAILDLRAGKLLAAKRTYPITLRNGWELPGGKLEPGERHEQALERELKEELGISVRILERVPGEWRLNDRMRMRVFACTITRGAPNPREHGGFEWVHHTEWDKVRWLTQDVDAVKASMVVLRRRMGVH